MNPSDLRLVGNLSKRQARRRETQAFAGVERLEDRRLLTATLTPIVTFDGVTIGSPAAVVVDTAGNLFGVTGATANADDTVFGSGEVFEVPAGTTTIKNLATFNFDSGIDIGTSLVVDSSGNLFGTEEGNSVQQGGTLFELAQGSSTLTPLATFAPHNLGTVTDVDSSGDVFGLVGGVPSELVQGSGAFTTLTTDVFLQTLQVGPDGNLYGTGDASGGGPVSIFEISPTTGMVTPLAAFDFATTGSGPTGFTFDSSGDLVGFCEMGGPSVTAANPNGQGTVWELPVGSSTISVVAGFDVGNNGPAGANPEGRPIIDGSGNLYGVTTNGGGNGYGTVFEVPAAVTSSIRRPNKANGTVTPDKLSDDIEEQVDLIGELYDTVGFIGPFPCFYGLDFGSSTSPPTAPGVIAKVVPKTTPPPPKQAQNPKTLKDAKDEIIDSTIKDIQDDTADQMKAKKGVTGNGGTQSKQMVDEPADSGLSGEFAQLKQMLAQVKSELNSATVQLNAATPFFNRYTSEESQITRLTAQLAKQTNPKMQAHLQNQITTAENAQNNDADTDNADCDNASADISAAMTGEAAVRTALNSIPVPFVQFEGTLAVVPDSLIPGKMATATVSFTNSGNATARGSLGVALALRPAGTSGSADVSLPTVRTPIHIAAGASANAKLHFVVPKSLPAGSYSLVVQLDPGNGFSEANLPAVIVSEATITAT